MLTIPGPIQRLCGGVTRRDFLRAGGLGFGGLTLAGLLQHEALAAQQGAGTSRPKSVIYVVLSGGPSHIDMWDLKPEAPSEYRGPFTPVATSLPGEFLCEHMPRQAAMLRELALVRGIRSVENDHFLSEVYTGLPRISGKRPAFGSIVSRLAGRAASLPTYISLDEKTVEQFEFEKPHYAGAGHAPFRPFGESIGDMTPVKNLEEFESRKSLLRALDSARRSVDRQLDAGGLDQFQAQALQIMTSPQVREAFDLSREPAETLERYGHKAGKYPHQTAKQILYDWNAKNFVLARRLVKAGARVVTVKVGDWDHHSSEAGDIFFALKCLMPLIDQSFTALCTDLKQRGLDQDVLVVMLGEFGRTPKITYPGPGREHWADAGCALFYGGGLRMGQVIGATDSRAERSISGTISFENVIATIYRVLGIDLHATLPDFNGRPQYLLDDRRPIRELVG